MSLILYMVCVMVVGYGFHGPLIGCLLYLDLGVCSEKKMVLMVFSFRLFVLRSVTCILRWASYREKATCPQCKHPFEFLNVHRALDGRYIQASLSLSLSLSLLLSRKKDMVMQEHFLVGDVGVLFLE